MAGREDSLTTAGAFVPPVDIYEDEHSIQLRLEVPGIDEKDLDVKVENNTLTVTGERKFEKEEKEENFRRVERRYGSFTRSFTLPNTVNTEDINASYDNGVLNIRLAKRAEAKPKQIKVSVGSQKCIEGKKPESSDPRCQKQFSCYCGRVVRAFRPASEPPLRPESASADGSSVAS